MDKANKIPPRCAQSTPKCLSRPGVTVLTDVCEHQIVSASSKHHLVPKVVEKLMQSWSTKDCYDHISPVSIPSHRAVVDIIEQARRILFPGYFTSAKLHAANLEYYIGNETAELYDKLAEQITMAIRHDCRRHGQPCTNCEVRANELSYQFIEQLPGIASILAQDIRATLEGDPAVNGPDEVIFSYPGLRATTVYRMAHELHRLGVPIIPRIMTEWAHGETGIDINPGATIGPGLFIDHGTGVVIGETTVIGTNVRLYQGVTLGALSLPRDAGEKMKHKKRHPTIEDNVIIYSNTTILGGDTVIGAGSVIGGNIWLTESVPPGTKVLLKRPELIYHHSHVDA
ncbi:serine O-acetyltransferase [Desulfofustis limnaeus]|jgi:serine O-acetyltransferase|uniref:Serine acetyltransferase n=1 Tax=Desulfofustis limnaeus TaxID=2740163 RepID=A0ABM7W6H8_9BACT|nr:serine acetyltransferase [Desulfofustis limnaeus]MDX9895934.1 serine acetyltransferase [Desulfofustis sp.]BDD86549.1 serine acetyltransferase [Desulfofustis limnaeus]